MKRNADKSLARIAAKDGSCRHGPNYSGDLLLLSFYGLVCMLLIAVQTNYVVMASLAVVAVISV